MAIEVQQASNDKPIIINKLVQVSVDRTPKDIKDYINAEQAAESKYSPNRALLYDIYARVIKDGTLTGVWNNKRIVKVTNKRIVYKDGNNKKVDTFDKLTQSDMFRKFIELCMQQKAWGLSGAEFIPGGDFKFVEIPRKHINASLKRITKYQYGEEGISYIDLPNVIILGDETDLGFLIKVAPLVLYKQGNWGDWADFIERYGQPIQEYVYDVYDEESRKEAFNLASNAGSNLAIVRPKQIEFDIKDGKQTNGDGKLQDSFRQAINEEIALIVVGNTLTSTSHGGGAYALGLVHQEDQDDIIESDINDITNVLNSKKFLDIVKSYGYPVVEGGHFEFEDETSIKELQEHQKIDEFLVNSVKLPLSHDYFYERYNRPKPDNYNDLIQQAAEKEAAEKEEEPSTPTKKATTNKPESAWFKVRKQLADFFDHGRVD